MWCDNGEEVSGHMHSVKINLGLLLISAHSSLLFDFLFLSHSLPCFDQVVILPSFLSQVLCFDQVVLSSFSPSLSQTSYNWSLIEYVHNFATLHLSHTSYNWSLMSMHVFKFYMMQRLVKWNSIGLLTLYI